MIGVLVIAIWALCSILHYGIWMAYFQKRYSLIADETYREDVFMGLATSICGPVSLIISLSLFGTKYGVMFVKRDLDENG